jgi:hypothetical protein
MARLMAEAPVQVQKTCSRNCSACVSRDEAAACCQPHEQVSPASWANRGPLIPPHHAEQAPPNFLPVILPREPPYLAYSC